MDTTEADHPQHVEGKKKKQLSEQLFSSVRTRATIIIFFLNVPKNARNAKTLATNLPDFTTIFNYYLATCIVPASKH